MPCRRLKQRHKGRCILERQAPVQDRSDRCNTQCAMKQKPEHALFVCNCLNCISILPFFQRKRFALVVLAPTTNGYNRFLYQRKRGPTLSFFHLLSYIWLVFENLSCPFEKTEVTPGLAKRPKKRRGGALNDTKLERMGTRRPIIQYQQKHMYCTERARYCWGLTQSYDAEVCQRSRCWQLMTAGSRGSWHAIVIIVRRFCMGSIGI